METQIFRSAIRVGNSAGVLLPKEWLNGYVRVELIEKPIEIKKDILEILDEYLEDVLGVYLVGSYARGDQDEKSDIDIIVISNNIKKEINKGKYNISIYPLNTIELSVKNNPLAILPRLLEAKTIINKTLLEKLKNNKINKNSFDSYINSSKRILKINKGFFNLDENLDENSVYSLILRLRGFYIISCLLKKIPYNKNGFLSFLNSDGLDSEKLHNIYQKVKSGKSQAVNIEKQESLKLLNSLDEQIKKYDKS